LRIVKVKKKKEQRIVLSNHIQMDNRGVFETGNRQQSRPDRKPGFLKRANKLNYNQIPCQIIMPGSRHVVARNRSSQGR
jgi:hypothetical protein